MICALVLKEFRMHLPSIESIEKFYKNVYISPHMDDGVISCGGRILKQLNNGESVLVVTVFTGNIDEERKPRGQALAHLINTNDRRVEDKRAMERLGVDYLWLDYIDSIFRRKSPLLRYGVTPGSSDAEKRLSEDLITDVRKICVAAANSNLYLPLGVGQHMDHQILFQVGRRLQQPCEISFYEDIPYALFPMALKYRMRFLGINYGPPAGSMTKPVSVLREIIQFYRAILGVPSLKLNNPFLKPIVFLFIMFSVLFLAHPLRPRASALGGLKLSPEVTDVSSVINEKLETISEYRSQLNTSMWNMKTLREALAGYSQAIGAKEGQYLERYWKTARNPYKVDLISGSPYAVK